MRRLWPAVPLVFLGAVFTFPCGPFLPEFEFATVHGPVSTAAAEESFDRGQLGVLRTHFYRDHLVVAYRYLSGVPLTDAEVAALAPRPAVQNTAPADQWTAAGRWLSARKQVPGAPQVASVDPYKQVPGGKWDFFPNCLDSAFDTAVATLRDRAAKWGGARDNLTEWLRGQDQVFQNCSGGPAIPPALSGGDALLAADRQYQIAAAEFYAGRYGDAARDFEAIAGDANSPWRDGGHYLAARALIRQGTIDSKPESLKAAEAKLNAVIADPAQKQWHESARGLIEFIRASLDPQQRMAELGKELSRPGLGPNIVQAMTDYTYLWDRQAEANAQPPAAADDITDWIGTFQRGPAEHAVERWRASRTAPWLVASLAWAKPSDVAAPDLIAAAQQIAPEAPAYPSAAYYGIRLEIQRGEADAAREWADRALATKQLESTTNLLRAERLKVARDWDEFLRYGPREPVALAFTWQGSDEPIEGNPEVPKKTAAFDTDFTRPMNAAVPLELWRAASSADAIPRDLQGEIARAAWVRAVLLDDPGARALAERTRELNPRWAAAIRDYLAQADPAAAKFAAVFWMLRMPGMSPELRNGIGRTTAVDRIDSFRDNWWKLTIPPANPESDSRHDPLLDLYPEGAVGPTAFLPVSQRRAGEAQAERLRQTAENGVDYLCAAAIAWARAHPRDARVPEALHLAVRATRYGLTDQASSRYSKEAFELLHGRYPDSPWTKQTKYWY